MIMNKKFDCVEMKRKIQEKLWDEIQPKSSEDYFIKFQKLITQSEFVQKMKQKHQSHTRKAA